jgi:hypothetical protein
MLRHSQYQKGQTIKDFVILPNTAFQTIFFLFEVPFSIRAFKYCNSKENNPDWPSATLETYQALQERPSVSWSSLPHTEVLRFLFPNYEVDLSFLVRNLHYQMKVLDWNHPVSKHNQW